MVKKELVDYLREYYGKYKFEGLKNKILSSGYSELDINDALNQLDSEHIRNPIQVSQQTYSSQKFNGAKWVKIGGIGGSIVLVFAVISIILSLFKITQSFTSPIFSILIFIVLIILIICILLFYLGFYNLGRFTNSRLLRFSAMSMAIIMIVFIIFTILAVILVWSWVSSFMGAGSSGLSNSMTGFAINDLANGENALAGFENTSSISSPKIGAGPIIAILVIVLLWLFFSIVQILFSVGLIKIGNQIKFSKIAGILNLILAIINILLFVVSIFFMVKTITNPIFILSIAMIILQYKTIFNIIQISFSVLGLLTLLLEIIVLFYGSKKFEG